MAEDAQRAEDQRIGRTPFPQPDAKTLPFPKFCEYWNALIILPVGKYARLYIRRWMPVLLPEEVEDERSGLKREVHPSEKKLTKDDGPLNDQLILDKVGVGNYTIRLNDTRLPWDRATVVHCEKFCTIRDWDHYPPYLDVKRLDWKDEDNQVYIKWGQSSGILPRPDQIGKDQDMANVAAIDSVLEDSRRERARTDQLQREALERAERETKEAKEAAARAQAVKPETPARPTTDLEAMGGVIVSLVNAVKPNPDNSLSEYLKLEAAREETRRQTEKEEREAARAAATAERERADKLQTEILTDLRVKAQAPTAVAAPALTLAQQFQEIEILLGTAKRIARGGSQTEEEPTKPGTLEKYAEIIPMVAPTIGQIVSGFFQTIQAGFQSWQNVAYNNALVRNGVTPQPPAMNKDQKPGEPIAPQPATLTPEQQAQKQQWDQIMQGVLLLAPHLVQSLDDGESGAEFAEFVIKRAPEKRTSYERIRHLADSLTLIGVQIPGATDLEKFIHASRFVFQRIPELWKKVETLPTMPQFLTDFYNYDEILAKAEEDQK